MPQTITLGEAVARLAAVEWFEAVAAVREVCRILVESGDRTGTPDLGQIVLTGDGELSLSGTARKDEPIKRLGQLLQALLAATEPPPVLRLVMSNAVAPSPAYATILDFDQALAYYERPDRRAVLRHLFARAVAAPAPDRASVPAPGVDEIAPLPPAPSPVTTMAQLRARRRIRVAAVCAALAVAVIGGLALARRAGVDLHTSRLSITAHRATARFDKAVVTAASSVTQWAGLGRLAGANPGTPPTSPSSESEKPAPRDTVLVRHAVRSAAPLRAFDLQPMDVSITVPPAEAPAAVEPAPEPASPAPAAPDARVYGPADSSVRPPVAVRPQLPRTLPEGVAPEDLTRFELVVAADGSVESVKLLEGARAVSVSETMLLSAAKTWRFAPAVKSGAAVRYRKTVWIQLD